MRRSRAFINLAVLCSLIISMSCSKTVDTGELITSLTADQVTSGLQEALIKAKPGTTIELPEGKFKFDKTLSLTVDKVTIRGKGLDKTVLSFSGQQAGSAGMLVKAGDFLIEDVAIEDAAGDALKVDGGTNITIRRVRVEWTGGPKTTNGPYGLYPVTCKNVLIEDSVAIAASDAGIYVGQSDQVIIRRNRAEKNVAAIEIENTKNADVYDNVVSDNTGGIMVFNLPDLPVQGGGNVRVYNNKVTGNNNPNFAPKGQIVYNLATGTGMLIMAVSNVEVFNNEIRDNNSANINIVSYLSASSAEEIKNPNYNPYVNSIYIHDNRISGGGKEPDSRLPKWQALAQAAGKPLGDVIYDGIVQPVDGKPGSTADAKVCLQNNGEIAFLNFDGGGGFKKISRDTQAHDCSIPALTAISLPNANSGKSGGGM